MFSKYLYTTGISASFRSHFKNYQLFINKFLEKNNPKENYKILDIGSNDGIFIKNFNNKKYKKFAVEPAKNLKSFYKGDVILFNNFFNKDLSRKIKKKYASMDFITANNVFAHIDNLQSVFSSVKYLLNENGVFCFEVSYLLDMVESKSFDSIYHEHLSYHSLYSLNLFFNKNNFNIIDVIKVPTHGGSIRVLVSKSKIFKINKNVSRYLEKEINLKINRKSYYKIFATNIKKSLNSINKIIQKSNKIVGIGAPAKCVTLLSNLEDTKKFKYIIDDNPMKQEKYIPNLSIQIKNSKYLYSDEDYDTIFIFAWNVYDDIKAKYQEFFVNRNVVIPFPILKILKYK